MKFKLLFFAVIALLLTGCGNDSVEPPPSVAKFERGEQTFYDPNKYTVGTDINQRMYVLLGKGNVELAKKDKVILTEKLDGRRYIKLREGETISFDGDLKLYPVGYAPKVTLNNSPQGLWQYQGGSDIQSGEYKVDGTGYVEVTTGTREDIGSSTIVKQNLSAGQSAFITVKDEEFLTLSNAIATFTKSMTQLAAEEKARFDESRSANNNDNSPPPKTLTLNMTSPQFVTAYNKVAPNNKIGNLEFVIGDVKDAGKFSFSDHLHLICSIDKSGKLLEVALISDPQSNRDIIAMLDAFQSVITVLNPNADVQNLMRNLNATRGNLDNLTDKSIVEGNVKYTVRKDTGQPFLFLVSVDL